MQEAEGRIEMKAEIIDGQRLQAAQTRPLVCLRKGKAALSLPGSLKPAVG